MNRRAVPLVTALVALAPLVTAAPPALAAVSCGVEYSVVSQWQGGFQGAVAVTNTGDPWTEWTLTFGFPDGQALAQGWNGTWAQSGSTVTVTSMSWNGTVAGGAVVGMGFLGSWNTSNAAPTSFSVNGITCGGGTTTRSTATASTTTTRPTTTRATTTTRSTTTRSTTTRSTTTTRTSTTRTSTTTTTSSGTGVLAQVHTVGRVADDGSTVRFTWPGTYFEGRFHGTGVGIVLDDSNNDYDVEVDGATVATLVAPGRTTHWIRDLTDADHTVRLAKRTESPWAAGRFGGFVAASGGAILARPAARTRQIEFIGDSFTAGYGNMSTSRDCSSTGGVTPNSNADRTFAAVAARNLGADYQLIAWSGMGMVRNYGGLNTDLSLRAYYDQTLQALWDSTVWQNPGTWRPQLVVVGLGINDFSTALTPGEKWATAEALISDYRTSYQGFLDRLRSRYGPGTVIVVSATGYGGADFPAVAQQIVRDRNAQGDSRVVFWDYTSSSLDFLGCDWHPSLHDEQILAGMLEDYLATLPLTW